MPKLICTCHQLTKAELVTAIKSHQVDSLKQIGELWGLTLSCDKCRQKIKKLIKKHR